MFGGYAFLAGLLLALPVGFLLLCLNVVVGMLSRAAPALNLFAIGLPASLAVGVVAILLAMPAMGDYMLVIIREALAAAPEPGARLMADEFGEKTEAPTAKRKQKAAEEGQLLVEGFRHGADHPGGLRLDGASSGPVAVARLPAVMTASFSSAAPISRISSPSARSLGRVEAAAVARLAVRGHLSPRSPARPASARSAGTTNRCSRPRRRGSIPARA
jgi:hypothetical protein